MIQAYKTELLRSFFLSVCLLGIFFCCSSSSKFVLAFRVKHKINFDQLEKNGTCVRKKSNSFRAQFYRKRNSSWKTNAS